MPTITSNGATSSAAGTALAALTVVSAADKNFRVFFSQINATTAVSTVAGGGVTNWNRAVTSGTTNGNKLELWYGTVDAVASAPTTITVGWAASITGIANDFVSQQFQANIAAPRWFLDVANSSTASTGTTVSFPSLTPQSGSRIYAASAFVAGTGTAGSLTGYTEGTTADGNPWCWNPAVTATAAPTATQTPSGYFDAVGGLFGVTDGAQFFTFF